MTTVIIRPNSPSGDWPLTAGGYLNDDSDGSYAEISNAYQWGYAQFDIHALPFSSDIRVSRMWVGLRARTLAGGPVTANIRVYSTVYQVLVNAPLVYTGTSFVTSTTAAQAVALVNPPLSDPGLTLEIRTPDLIPLDADGLRVSEGYLYVTYATPPTATVSAPAGTYSTKANPAVTWIHTPGSDGGTQAAYQVAIYNDDAYLSGGFAPGGEKPFPVWTSGIVYLNTPTVTPPAIPNDTYRAYVRTAQSINGVLHWSAWSYSGFVVNIPPPTTPTLTATADNANARIRLDITGALSATAISGKYELQRSTDSGDTWVAVRADDTGYIESVGGARRWWDYETGNAETAIYRVRTICVDALGQELISAWSTSTSPTSWTSASMWLKSPTTPGLNVIVDVQVQPSHSRPIPRGIYDGLGSAWPVVVHGTRRAGRTGALVFAPDTEADADALDALYDLGEPLLLQTPSTFSQWGSRYIDVGDIQRDALIDQVFSDQHRWDTVGYVEVQSPDTTAYPKTGGATWAEVIDTYATWLALETALTSWAELRE